MRMLYDEHAAALWRYAVRLTGDRARAEDVVQETLLRAWQHPEVVGDSERSARAWLFTVARNMIIDERRSARFRRETGSLDSIAEPENPGPDRGQRRAGSVARRRRDGPTVRRTPRGDPAVLLPGLDDSADRRGPGDRRGYRKIALALRGPGAATHYAGNGGDSMTTGFPGEGGAVLEDPYAMWDAAYVLGSLSSAERREYENHLSGCKSCRTAVAELSGMPALLALVDRDDMARAEDEAAIEPPPLRPEVLAWLLAKVSWRRRRQRWITGTVVAAAAAVLAVGVLVAARPMSPLPEQSATRSDGDRVDDDAGGALGVGRHAQLDQPRLGHSYRDVLHVPRRVP